MPVDGALATPSESGVVMEALRRGALGVAMPVDCALAILSETSNT